eukprot:gnl/MRDRNA2_/MRDRNA2_21721_c0_seq1.p1 gnl/MRDRNA2_/MRDRNA2_21721_c0~~gnl/MRDRNA2_/MRDRNA2_21721_c0_seq1.p1  ORF type:complete len:446 (-),score=69.98 gnl/MRDRNA2_/MRDRNA2_21721_c0_seq1:76-1314(-)
MYRILLAFFALYAQPAQALKVQKGFEGHIATKTFEAKLVADSFMEAHVVVPELTPQDFEKARRFHEEPNSTAKWLYLGSNAVIMALIAVIYYDRGTFTVISIMALVLSLSLMSNTIQSIFAQGFKYPQFITSCHQLISFVAAGIILVCRQRITGQKINYPTVDIVTKGLGPVAILFAASLGCSNLALLYTNTHFYEMLTPLNSVTTFAIGLALGQNRSNYMQLLAPLALVTLSVPFVTTGELNFSVLGLVISLFGILFRACKAQLQTLLMSAGAMSQSFDPVELLCWTSLLCFIVMTIWTLVAEGLAPYKAIQDVQAITAVLISCACAVVLNLSQLTVQKSLGPVAQQIIGGLKGCLATLGAVAAFGEVVSLQQIVGYSLAIAGVAWYNRADKEVKEQAKMAADEKNQAEKA